tara:strand:- start:18 stop:416 length:399 start_codon:yes stop_codon:yes gene_type:complete
LNGAITEHIQCDVIRVGGDRLIGATVLRVSYTQTFWGFVAVMDDSDVLVRVMNDDPRVQSHLGIFVCDPYDAVAHQQIPVLKLGDISVMELDVAVDLEITVDVNVPTRGKGGRRIRKLDDLIGRVSERSYGL